MCDFFLGGRVVLNILFLTHNTKVNAFLNFKPCVPNTTTRVLAFSRYATNPPSGKIYEISLSHKTVFKPPSTIKNYR